MAEPLRGILYLTTVTSSLPPVRPTPSAWQGSAPPTQMPTTPLSSMLSIFKTGGRWVFMNPG